MATNTTHNSENDSESTSSESENTETARAASEYERSASTRRNSAPLLARRRANLDRDGHIDAKRFDFRRDEDGHKIRRIVSENKETGDDVKESDLTALEGAAPSTTSSLRLIEFEAEILDDGGSIENPHIPSNDDVLRSALDHLRPMDLTPAWEVIDG